MVAAASFAICNVLSKLVLAAGSDVLTLSLFRGLVGVALLFIWLKAASLPSPLTPRARLISLGLGLLFAGVVFGLFAAISIVTVPIAVLTYFIYPLLTGIAGALLGIDKMGWRGAVAAVVAFMGLALMIGAHPQQLAWAGVAFAIGAAVCRTAI
jgi:drug/metabolite transporter (DMT)-like permease